MSLEYAASFSDRWDLWRLSWTFWATTVVRTVSLRRSRSLRKGCSVPPSLLSKASRFSRRDSMVDAFVSERYGRIVDKVFWRTSEGMRWMLSSSSRTTGKSAS